MTQDKLFAKCKHNKKKQKQTKKFLATLSKAFLFATITFIKKSKIYRG